ncbi:MULTISPECIES: LysR family transcriptional regulator [unclassified Pseudovibrio]|uniref:LysR family transcriptional regulator n=1 Tax=unclassified Pseudovibrio TaxID=2627060 RepID=UPI0007AE6985|nr:MULTISPECIES: LysR family transcriptional regulator [unclassified Pseudovibrio]KZK99994.1 HTH-type transcriptional regulator DmlR [Pseudovibrio sp. W74]KZL11824.1 HTH-type transcriptional regulator DmlR [Pseudovibrio sp. Ad14]
MMKRIAYFNAVMEAHSITEASRRFDLQPSSISRQIVSLEEELGVRLLNRNTRKISPTEAGLRFYSYSRQILSDLDEAKRAISDLQQEPQGTLTISSTVGFGETVILPLVPEFLANHPKLNIKVELTERVVDLIEEGVDVAIRSGKLSDSSLIARHLLPNNFIICASPTYLQRAGTPETADDLSHHCCIKYGYAGWANWFQISEKIERLTLGDALETNSVNGQKQLILNHGGLALIPHWAVRPELDKGDLVQVLPDLTFSPHGQQTSTYAIYLKREQISPKIKVFTDFIIRQIKASD